MALNIQFPVTLPDEPYKTAVTKKETFTCTYTGPRYVLMQIDRDDFQVREGGRGDKATDDSVNEKFFEQDEYFYLLVDATESADTAFYCAYVTHEYTHPDVEDFECTEQDADGEDLTWTHQYEGTTGMLGHLYWQETLLYNPGGSGWSGPNLREHVNDWASMVSSCEEQAKTIDAALDDSNQSISAEDRAILIARSAWLKKVEVKYKDIDHWKIPFPEAPLPQFDLPE
jgi:hypothetical protein|tara:strand:- start:485 stop:1168 length:684 start_codon:yes stop_codon:yes gene_type:complete